MTRNLDDLQLAQACRAGRTEAYGELVARTQGRLYPMALRLLGSPDDAQDLLQDAFVRGFEKLDQFQGESSFFTWIYRIAVNLALSRLRKQGLRRVLRLPELRPGGTRDYEIVDETEAAGPSLALERAEREAVVTAALNDLDPDHRAVVILKDYEDKRYEEIADLLHIPVGTVRSRLHRARRELRRKLSPLLRDDELGPSIATDVENALS